jgi:hypothetical protein
MTRDELSRTFSRSISASVTAWEVVEGEGDERRSKEDARESWESFIMLARRGRVGVDTGQKS